MNKYIPTDMDLISPFFKSSTSTLITSYLTNCMGTAYVDRLRNPLSAQLSIGDFIFFSGIVNENLLMNIETNSQIKEVILVPQNRDWEKAILFKYKNQIQKHIRYATKKEPSSFNIVQLKHYLSTLSDAYELKPIDKELYQRIIVTNWAADLCNNYTCSNDFIKHGLGYVVLKDNKIVAGASSYSYYPEGIEIQIDTYHEERRKGLALVCGAKLILSCLKRGLYPNWDAHTKESLALAKKLGYTLDRAYPVYIVSKATLNE